MQLAGKFESPLLVSFAMLAVALSTLATNIAANIVSPANDFSNLAPSRIDFKKGGYITGILGVLIIPWKLIADPNGYIFTWLIAYSSLLGPIGGIMIIDYYFVHKRELIVQDLYSSSGRCWYSGGFNRTAIIAMLAGILPNVPGFLTTIKVVPADAFPGFINDLYHYAWFVGFAISAGIYYALSKKNKIHSVRSPSC